MAAEIEKLIERLEKLTGPDRELDCYIFVAINPRWLDEDVKNILLKPYLVCKYGEDKCCNPQHQIEDGFNADHLVNVPNFTSSIDAALTLVPEGFTRSVDATAPELDIDVDLHHKNHAKVIRGAHSSEAMATCIAALRALSHKGSSNG